mmetsp:Transcript_1734/g.6258  ORF Transcript_1734/g.6258 Transcript_1734/m.6258 type:complete len:414 (+) Transcript_1734:380-1621(+)
MKPSEEVWTEAASFFCSLFAVSKDCGIEKPDDCQGTAQKVFDSYQWNEKFVMMSQQFVNTTCGEDGGDAVEIAKKAQGACPTPTKPGGDDDMVSITGGEPQQQLPDEDMKMAEMCRPCLSGGLPPRPIDPAIDGSVSDGSSTEASSGIAVDPAPTRRLLQEEKPEVDPAMEPAVQPAVEEPADKDTKDTTTDTSGSSSSGDLGGSCDEAVMAKCEEFLAKMTFEEGGVDKPTDGEKPPRPACPVDVPDCQTLLPVNDDGKDDGKKDDGEATDSDATSNPAAPGTTGCPDEAPNCNTLTATDDIKRTEDEAAPEGGASDKKDDDEATDSDATSNPAAPETPGCPDEAPNCNTLTATDDIKRTEDEAAPEGASDNAAVEATAPPTLAETTEPTSGVAGVALSSAIAAVAFAAALL